MRILSFDTTTEILHLALLERDQVVLEKRSDAAVQPLSSEAPRQEAIARLLPGIDEIVKEAGWDKQTLDLIVVGEGPGSFTGIRTGVVTARTLAQALALPLVAVCSLECYASCCESLPCAVVLNAGRGHYFVAAYAANASAAMALEVKVAPTYVAESDMLALTAPYSFLCADEGSCAQILKAGRAAQALPNVKNIATRQAQIAWNRLSLRVSGLIAAEKEESNTSESRSEKGSTLQKALLENFPYQEVEPLYLRSPSVTIKSRAGDKTHGN